MLDKDGQFTYSHVRQLTINHSPLTFIQILPTTNFNWKSTATKKLPSNWTSSHRMERLFWAATCPPQQVPCCAASMLQDCSVVLTFYGLLPGKVSKVLWSLRRLPKSPKGDFGSSPVIARRRHDDEAIRWLLWGRFYVQQIASSCLLAMTAPLPPRNTPSSSVVKKANDRKSQIAAQPSRRATPMKSNHGTKSPGKK